MTIRFHFLLTLSLSLISVFTFAQKKTNIKQPNPLVEGLPFTSVTIDNNTPDWAVMMYTDNPNIFHVEELYSKWRIDNPTIINGHTRNFKHFYNYLSSNEGIGKDGYIIPNLEVNIYQKQKEWQQDRLRILKSKNQNSRTSTNNTDWISIGPHWMRRNGEKKDAQANIYAITQSISNPDVLYASSEAGGTVFKTTDKGENWSSVNDNISFNGSRELEVDPTNVDIVYLGSKHDVYKTTDGGLNWFSVYYNWNFNPNSIIIDPSNVNNIIISGSERIIRSTNGGTTWTEVYAGKAYDLKFKPGDSQVVYALMDNTTSLQTDFYKSTDNGATWTNITSGWPLETSTSNAGGRMTTSDGNPGIIYAFIGASYTAAPTSKEGIKVVKSTDSGSTWVTVLNYTDAGGVNRGQGYYDWDIEMSDTDPDIVLLGTQNKWLTTDGFATTNWAHTGLGHSDLQEALFNGNDLWLATDGGIIKFDDETFDHYEVKSTGINATSFWSFDQGWNRDAQVGSHYHNGTSARTDSYTSGEFLNYGGAEPQFSAIKHPTPDKAWSKGYGAVNGKSLPDNIDDPITNFGYNITPNAEYGSTTWKESEIEVLPYAYNTHFTGSGNVLWRSDDFGASWDTVAVFGNTSSKVTKIEIPRSNPDIIYVAEYNPSYYQLYKSEDFGTTFTNISGPSGVWDSGVLIEVDQSNEDILYFSTTNGGDSNDKVYKSIDAGQTWTNLSTDMLDGHAARAILNVAGTDGGLYIVSSKAVFYRNNTMSDWEILLTNLPASPKLRDIKPYYKEGKVRVAGDGRGVWGAEFYDMPTTVIVQPTVNIVDGQCSRDTFYFDDFSIVNHTDMNWEWEITPTPLYIEDLNIRNPKVVLGNNGSYTVNMKITNLDGTIHEKEIIDMITLDNKCDADTIPGNAFKGYTNSDYMVVDNANLTDITHFTVTGWWKPDSTLRPFSALFSSGDWCAHCDYTEGLIVDYWGSKLWYKWPGNASNWGSNSGMLIPMNKWSYVAMVIEPDKATLYLNEQKYVHNIALDPGNISSFYIGRGHYNKSFGGEIDEVTLWNRALNYDEIKAMRHITKEDQIETDPDLIAYYQFNEPSGDKTILDRSEIYHGVLQSNAELVNSTTPIGGGSSEIFTITSGGIINSTITGVELEFPSSGTYPDGDIVISKINLPPNVNPSNGTMSKSYWIINNYGNNTTFTQLTSLKFSDIGNITPNSISVNYSIYEREDNDHLGTWIYKDRGDELTSSDIKFDQDLIVDSFGQLVVINEVAKGWIGVESSAWDNPQNWGQGILPTSNSDVIIPVNTPYQPIVNINTVIRSLTIMRNASLQVEDGILFEVKE